MCSEKVQIIEKPTSKHKKDRVKINWICSKKTNGTDKINKCNS